MKSTIIILAVLSVFALSARADDLFSTHMRGTNLGGWFVLEMFVNDTIFQNMANNSVACEWDLCMLYKNDEATLQAALEAHWRDFVTEEDIAKLDRIGITHVRIPLGYWALLSRDELRSRNEPYMTGQWPYLVSVLKLLKNHNMKAIIDLHGAPGSQSGFDNSGQITPIGWGRNDTINRTLDVLDRLSQKVAALETDDSTSGVVIGIGVLNEPATFDPTFPPEGLDLIKSFYISAYSVIRQYLPSNRYMIVIDSAFKPFDWTGFMAPPQYENVWMDLHIYHIFDKYLRQAPPEVHMRITCNDDKRQVDSQTLPTLVGEWSAAWKESANASTEAFPTPEQQQFMRQYILGQMHIFKNWFFWNFKTISSPMWDMFLGADHGWWPINPTEDDMAAACTPYVTSQ